jgi:protein-tyrosine-phosphatase
MAFVCTANRFRSVLAAGVAARALEDLPVRICSLGITDVGPGKPLPGALEAAARIGIDLTGHRALVLSRGALADFDLVVGFELAHVAAAVVEGGARIRRTFVLREIVDLVERVRVDGTLDWFAHAEAVLLPLDERADQPRSPRPIPDPAGRSHAAQRAIAGEIVDLTSRMLRGLFGAGIRPIGASGRDH